MGLHIHRHPGIAGADAQDFSGCRILLLEPAMGTARLLILMLTRDLQVGKLQRVKTLGDAVRALATGEFNVLITDWSPSTDAVKLIKAVRSAKSVDRYLPVIVMTQQTGEAELRHLRDVGVDEVMRKPFTLRMLCSRLQAVGRPGRPFIVHDAFFGPDRRRFRTHFTGEQRRNHANDTHPDRRRRIVPLTMAERRQGWPGFRPWDRRANNVRTRMAELEAVCDGLDIPLLLALRHLTLSDPQFQGQHYEEDLGDFFTVQLMMRLERLSFEKLEQLAGDGFAELLPSGDEGLIKSSVELLRNLARPVLQV